MVNLEEELQQLAKAQSVASKTISIAFAWVPRPAA
jgi:hypothetical protein